MNVKIIFSKSNDIWFNLALEHYLFMTMPNTDHYLFLYRNIDAIVIGRSQNPWKECNLSKLSQSTIKLARRQSGGGTVFHDLGNICFSFMSGKPGYEKNNNFSIVISTLKKLGIDAYKSQRNDLLVNHMGSAYKISGNAFREKQDRAFHHGTLLLNTDLKRLEDYLYIDHSNIDGKGVNSIRSSVINLQTINHSLSYDLLSQTMAEEFSVFYGSRMNAEYIDEASLRNQDFFLEHFNLQKDWDWQYGRTFEFTQKFQVQYSWGQTYTIFFIEQGIIKEIELREGQRVLEDLTKILIGSQYRRLALEEKLKNKNLTQEQDEWVNTILNNLP